MKVLLFNSWFGGKRQRHGAKFLFEFNLGWESLRLYFWSEFFSPAVHLNPFPFPLHISHTSCAFISKWNFATFAGNVRTYRAKEIAPRPLMSVAFVCMQMERKQSDPIWRPNTERAKEHKKSFFLVQCAYTFFRIVNSARIKYGAVTPDVYSTYR